MRFKHLLGTAAVAMLAAATMPVCAETLYVNGESGDDGNDGLTPGTAKGTIDGAIAAASAGDTIIVAVTEYAPFTVDKSLTIIGESLIPARGINKPTINGDGSFSNGITVLAGVSDVQIQNFWLQNFSSSSSHEGWGVYVEGGGEPCANVTFESLDIELAESGGVRVAAPASGVHRNLSFSDVENFGVDTMITRRGGPSIPVAGLRIENSRDVNIVNCEFSGGDHALHVVAVDGAVGATITSGFNIFGNQLGPRSRSSVVLLETLALGGSPRDNRIQRISFNSNDIARLTFPDPLRGSLSSGEAFCVQTDGEGGPIELLEFNENAMVAEVDDSTPNGAVVLLSDVEGSATFRNNSIEVQNGNANSGTLANGITVRNFNSTAPLTLSIHNNSFATDGTFGSFDSGIWLRGSMGGGSVLYATQNSFDGFRTGIRYDESASLGRCRVTYNSFTGAADNAINWTGPAPLDARYNFFGDATGPSGGATDPVAGGTASGAGTAITGNGAVRFQPFLTGVHTPPAVVFADPANGAETNDGTTTDAALLSLQQAFDAVGAGGIVNAAEGTYNAPDDINLWIGKGMQVHGAGLATIEGDTTASTTFGMRTIGSVTSVMIDGFGFDGHYVGVFADAMQDWVSAVQVSNCNFQRCGLDNVLTDPRPNVTNPVDPLGTFATAPLYQSVAPGAISMGGVSQLFVLSNTVQLGGAPFAFAAGLTGYGLDSSYFYFNSVTNDPKNGGALYGIYVGAGDQLPFVKDVAEVWVHENLISGVRTAGIEVVDGRTTNLMTDISISENQIDGVADCGISVHAGGPTSTNDGNGGSISGLSITYNEITNCGFGSSARGGIRVFTNASNSIDPQIDEVLVAYNSLKDCGTDQPYGGAISIDRGVNGPDAATPWVYLNTIDGGSIGFNSDRSVADGRIFLALNRFANLTEGIRIGTRDQIVSIADYFDNMLLAPYNLFSQPALFQFGFCMFENRSVINTAGTYSFDGAIQPNWFADTFGEDTNESENGMTGGNGVIDNSGFPLQFPILTDGSAGKASSAAFARWDYDLDGLPDAIEFSGAIPGTLFNNPDTDSNDVADGWEFDSMSPAPFPGFLADGDTDGYLDYWLASFAATNHPLTGFDGTPYIGDVTGDGTVDLGDAVRSLQIINRTFGPNDVGSVPDAMQVTLAPWRSLNNALQILRWQSGARQQLPAIPGTM